MGSEPASDNDNVPEPSRRFKISSILWALFLVGVAIVVGGQALLIMGTKANTKFGTVNSAFGTVGPSIGATVSGGSQ